MGSDNAPLTLEATQRLARAFRNQSAIPFEVIDIKGHASAHTPKLCGRQPLCALLAQNRAAHACCTEDHQRALHWAFSMGDSYCFFCHAGLLVMCTPLADGPRRLGAILCGKTLPENSNAEMVDEIWQRVQPFGLDCGQVRAAVKGHTFAPGRQLQDAANLLFVLAQEVLGLDMRSLIERREQAGQQAQIAAAIHAVKSSTKYGRVAYPYEREKELIEKVKLGDRQGAKGVLNEILGAVLFRDPMGSYLLKTRLVELLAVLSRAAAEADVDVEKVLERNIVYFAEILNSTSDADLCLTISKALNDFLDTVCARRDTRVGTPITAVMKYIEQNFQEELAVQDMARQAHLSPSRLAHVFQEQTGSTLMETLTHVRLENAKHLLLETNLSCTEIAYRVGYNDQSYFTRVFRRHERMTPRRFRALNRDAARLKPST